MQTTQKNTIHIFYSRFCIFDDNKFFDYIMAGKEDNKTSTGRVG